MAPPERAEGRFVGAEMILREFRSGSATADRPSVWLDSMAADGRLRFGPASDQDLEEAVLGQTITSDLDVATDRSPQAARESRLRACRKEISSRDSSSHRASRVRRHESRRLRRVTSWNSGTASMHS